jgi:prepilin-type N-terminal cleavage/methylation domain-containing protein
MNERGFTLAEALVSLVILAVTSTAIMTSFMAQTTSNTRSEHRVAAAKAAEQVLESLRMDDPGSMPSSGVVGPQLVTVNERQFEVFVSYCANPNLCDTRARHLLVEMYLNGRRVYDVETVFTQLR